MCMYSLFIIYLLEWFSRDTLSNRKGNDVSIDKRKKEEEGGFHFCFGLLSSVRYQIYVSRPSVPHKKPRNENVIMETGSRKFQEKHT